MKKLAYLFLPLLIISCNSKQKNQNHKNPNYTLNKTIVFETNDSTEVLAPLSIEFKDFKPASANIHTFTNEDKIEVDKIEVDQDSMRISFAVFNTSLTVDTNKWIGYFTNHDGPYTIPVHLADRELKKSDDYSTVGNYEVEFDYITRKVPAIASFKKQGDIITGTFLGKTGDYRFISGYEQNGKLQMYAFDGSSILNIKARIKGDTIYGDIHSGKAGYKTWKGVKTDKQEIADPGTLTFMKNPDDVFHFTYSNWNGEKENFKVREGSKVTLVQIMGTWCHNCMDEGNYFKKVYQKYNSKGLDILGVTFERSDNAIENKPRMDKMVRNLNINYPIVFGGSTKESSEVMNSLNRVSSYPTTIMLDSEGKVIYIHTGFSGPGTGDKFITYQKEFESLIEENL